MRIWQSADITWGSGSCVQAQHVTPNTVAKQLIANRKSELRRKPTRLHQSTLLRKLSQNLSVTSLNCWVLQIPKKGNGTGSRQQSYWIAYSPWLNITIMAPKHAWMSAYAHIRFLRCGGKLRLLPFRSKGRILAHQKAIDRSDWREPDGWQSGLPPWEIMLWTATEPHATYRGWLPTEINHRGHLCRPHSHIWHRSSPPNDTKTVWHDSSEDASLCCTIQISYGLGQQERSLVQTKQWIASRSCPRSATINMYANDQPNPAGCEWSIYVTDRCITTQLKQYRTSLTQLKHKFPSEKPSS